MRFSLGSASWLCKDPSDEKFGRYVGDGLKPEVELKKVIDSKTESPGTEARPIETRMLESIKRHMDAVSITEAEIEQAKKMPNMESLFTHAGFDRLTYLAFYRMGSHHVHGTWPSLYSHYLEDNGKGDLVPRGNDVSTRANEYIGTSLMMLKALMYYTQYVLDESATEAFTVLFEATERENLDIFQDMEAHGF